MAPSKSSSSSSFLRLGSAWYPEQCDRRVLEQDVRLMVELGLNTVRVGEFAWARWEPSPGQYETKFMRDAMDLAHAHDIGVVLCTPTAAPPAWLLTMHPELGYVNQDGLRYGHGGRQQGDYNNPLYREYGRNVTAAIARDLGRHPALIAWQTDNELRGHQKVSVSPTAVEGWHAWLRVRYNGDIEQLNKAWGTDVWSQRYRTFEEVPPPLPLPTYSHSMSLLTNYRRYMNDSVVAFQREQVEIIRQHSDAPITHNSEDSVDEWDLTRDLDFTSADVYIEGGRPERAFYRYDCMRNLKPDRPYWLMETGSESLLFGKVAPAGWAACHAALSFFSGGAAISYWPWRQQAAGAEIDHSAIISASGNPTIAWPALRTMTSLAAKIEPLLREFRPAPAEVAFVRSETNGYFFFVDRVAGLEPNFNFRGRLEEEYDTIHHLGVWRDVLYDQAPPRDGHRIVFSPYLPHASTGFLQRMRTFVENGGAWVAGPYCGYRERDHTVPLNGELGELGQMLGIDVLPMMSLGASNGITLADGTIAHASMRALAYRPRPGQEVLGTYDHPRLNGAAWGLVVPLGKGRVYLPGGHIDAVARSRVYGDILNREGIARLPFTERLSIFPHKAADGRHAWAIVNWDDVPHDVALPSPGRDALRDTTGSGTARLEPMQCAFILF